MREASSEAGTVWLRPRAPSMMPSVAQERPFGLVGLSEGAILPSVCFGRQGQPCLSSKVRDWVLRPGDALTRMAPPPKSHRVDRFPLPPPQVPAALFPNRLL